MRLKELHSDVSRYLKEDCYCPNEVYSVDGFGYMLVYDDAECKIIHKRKKDGAWIYLVATYSEDEPILMTVWLSEDEKKIDNMERYDLTNHNIKEILEWMDGKKNKVHLSEHDRLLKETQQILSFADLVDVG